MKKIETLCQMLEEKTEYFREYEDATEKLLSVDVEEMENQMNRRQKLIVKIDYLDARLREAAQSLGEMGDDAWRAVRLEKGKSEIPQELWPVFEKAQEACAVANRIRRKEPRRSWRGFPRRYGRQTAASAQRRPDLPVPSAWGWVPDRNGPREFKYLKICLKCAAF